MKMAKEIGNMLVDVKECVAQNSVAISQLSTDMNRSQINFYVFMRTLYNAISGLEGDEKTWKMVGSVFSMGAGAMGGAAIGVGFTRGGNALANVTASSLSFTEYVGSAVSGLSAAFADALVAYFLMKIADLQSTVKIAEGFSNAQENFYEKYNEGTSSIMTVMKSIVGSASEDLTNLLGALRQISAEESSVVRSKA